MRRLLGISLIAIGILIAIVSVGKPLLPSWDFRTGWQAGESHILPIEDVKRIDINVQSAAVYISTAETDQIGLELKKREGSQSTIETIQQGERLIVKVNQSSFNFLGGIIALFSGQFKEELYVTLPHNYSESLYVKSSSGSLAISGLEKLQDLDVDISSGSVTIEDVSVESFRYDGSSGRLTVRDLQAELNDIKISSGKVNLERIAGEIRGKSSSGSVTIDMVSLDAPVKWQGSSGTITLHLPETSSFELTASTSSGSVYSDFPLMVHAQSRRDLKGTVGNGDVPIELRVSSGKINIERNHR
ncbi:lia operon protein LiaG [Caldalkalibacillus uzonensis]|uniref:Lia operon protein LiaG n=1 Tax=Caldalkalibacillus uzonensis TaxID=353224 RepID=A0ABU0CX06_9BACI|nr:DUF4097 family beta strand repeat-containing protein [Caldalkalibacillus uzonensis]MDQ0340677.1 lia operon protein LiaG [Caldalkalibacillus uzonensis]